MGSHSLRKFAITWASTGTPDFAPLIAIAQLARWSTKALDIILRYAKLCEAGDALVGRLLALLDPQEEEFQVVAPHFVPGSDGEKKIKEIVALMFGECTNEELKKTLPFFAASIIFHWPFLKENLGEDHILGDIGWKNGR